MRCKHKVCHANTLDGTKCMSCVGPKGTNTKKCSVCWQHKVQCQIKKRVLTASHMPQTNLAKARSGEKELGVTVPSTLKHKKLDVF